MALPVVAGFLDVVGVVARAFDDAGVGALAALVEVLAAGGTTAGFSSNARARVAKLRPGDYLLCYLVEVKH